MPKKADRKKANRHAMGVFPAPTLSQLEDILDERQKKDRRKNSSPIKFEERRKQQRRVTKDN